MDTIQEPANNEVPIKTTKQFYPMASYRDIINQDIQFEDYEPKIVTHRGEMRKDLLEESYEEVTPSKS